MLSWRWNYSWASSIWQFHELSRGSILIHQNSYLANRYQISAMPLDTGKLYVKFMNDKVPLALSGVFKVTRWKVLWFPCKQKMSRNSSEGIFVCGLPRDVWFLNSRFCNVICSDPQHATASNQRAEEFWGMTALNQCKVHRCFAFWAQTHECSTWCMMWCI